MTALRDRGGDVYVATSWDGRQWGQQCDQYLRGRGFVTAHGAKLRYDALPSDSSEDNVTSALPKSVRGLIEKQIENALSRRMDAFESAMQEEAHRLNLDGVLQSGAAVRAFQTVVEDELRHRAVRIREIIDRVLEADRTTVTEAAGLELKRMCEARLRAAESELKPRLVQAMTATGGSIPSLGPVVQECLEDLNTEIDLYVLRGNQTIPESNDSFARSRDRLESRINLLMPKSAPALIAIQTNLRSSNPELWANSVNSVRRLLEDLADLVFPAQVEDRSRIAEDGDETRIALGKPNYINRIVAFVEDNSGSQTFTKIVGSHLRYVGERLDAAFAASQKGSHAEISTREEADRYVQCALTLVTDILSLLEESRIRNSEPS